MSATTKTGVFYAYAKNINDDWSYRFMITFANRDVADSWYRLVTDSVAGGYARFKSVSRVSMQFYTHNPAEGNIFETINDARVALSLRGQIFFTLLPDRGGRDQSAIPVLNYTEYTNGGRFFIRSSADDNTFWYYDPATRLVVASRTRRTKFIITIDDPKRVPGEVIVASDDVYVTLDSGSNIGVVNAQNQLGISTNPFPFEFSSFSTDFEVDYYSQGSDATLGVISRDPAKGEKWELV